MNFLWGVSVLKIEKSEFGVLVFEEKEKNWDNPFANNNFY